LGVENLTGNYLIRIVRPAFSDAHKWLPRSKDRAEARRHALKLRYWPTKSPEDENGVVLDVDWSWIQAFKGLRIGELRINDKIGNCDNLRVIFFDPKTKREKDPLPVIWILAIFQKKADDFNKAQLTLIKARKNLVMERFYGAID
jgi:hypothetical protein